MQPGTRDEQALRRRLAILALLHTRPHTYPQLRAALLEQGLIDSAYLDDTVLDGRLIHQFRSDRKALRLAGCDIVYDRPSGRYCWTNSPFGLSLTNPELLALGILRDTFAATTMPHQADIAGLLDRLLCLLPEEQRTTLQRKRRPYRVAIPETTDYRNADPRTLSDIERAITDGQQLQLAYRSAKAGIERQHTVEPRPLVHKNGHVYLPVYNVLVQKEFDLRLDYIVPGSTRVLPQRAQPGRPPPPSYTLRYHLAPVLARNQVSEHFPDQQVERHPDGSATVTAAITDRFAARQILLRYGEHCTILEPPELVAEFRATAAVLYQIYCSGGE